MNQREFFEKFDVIVDSYSWHQNGREIVGRVRRGVNKGRLVNPVTAVARSLGKGFFDIEQISRRNTLYAGESIGITEGLSIAIYNACLGTSCNGHAVVVKGKVLRSIVFSNKALLSIE